MHTARINGRAYSIPLAFRNSVTCATISMSSEMSASSGISFSGLPSWFDGRRLQCDNGRRWPSLRKWIGLVTNHFSENEKAISRYAWN